MTHMLNTLIISRHYKAGGDQGRGKQAKTRDDV